MPFAAAGMRGPMLSYAGPVGAGTGYVHHGPYAVVDVQTTGLRPGRGDRVVEIAVARVDSGGRIEDEFATLVNPGRDTGPEFLHGIGNADVQRAPTFDQVVPELLQRLDGAVLVAHNAPFEEAFLRHELRRAGVKDLRLPALCTLWLGRQTFDTPNYKLGTLARHANVPLPDGHVALGHARTVSALLPMMLGRYGRPLGYGCDPHQHSVVTPATPARLVTRAVALRKGADGYMSSLLTRLPMTANEADDTFVEVYLEALSEVLADGKIVADEAKQLAQLAGAAGLGRTQIAALNERFLESMREVALARTPQVRPRRRIRCSEGRRRTYDATVSV